MLAIGGIRVPKRHTMPMIRDGWIGPADQLLYYLSVVGADKDADGKFLIAGEPLVSFLGMNEEYVVPAGTVYYVDGHPCNLAAGLASTSYGVKVKVI